MSRAICVLALALTGCTLNYTKEKALDGRATTSSSSATTTGTTASGSASTNGSGTSSTSAVSTGASAGSGSSNGTTSASGTSTTGSSGTSAAVCPAGAYFCDDFESGTPSSRWMIEPDDAGSVTVDSADGYQSGHSLHIEAFDAGGMYVNELIGVRFDGGYAYPFYVRAMIKPSSSVTQGSYALMYIEPLTPDGSGDFSIGPDQAPGIYLGAANFNTSYGYGVPDEATSTQAVFASDQWNCIEWEVDAAPVGSAPDSGSELVWFNGALLTDAEVHNVAVPNVEDLLIGLDGYPNGDGDVWFDDIAVGPTRMGCP